MIVEFNFEIDEKVVSPLGQIGIVSWMAVDNSGTKQIFTDLASGQSTWYKESLVKKATE